jgi:SET and MYND domain-containing protein
MSNLVHLNSASLTSDIHELLEPLINNTRYQQLPKTKIEAIYSAWQATTLDKAGGPMERMRLRWRLCQPLIEAKMWAVEPLSTTILDMSVMYQSDSKTYANALSLACFLATECYPYKLVPPFMPWRVKSLLIIARLLTQTAPLAATGDLAKSSPHRRLVVTLSNSDQISMCEAVLRLVLRWGPLAHSDDWIILKNATEILAEIESLDGRDKEAALLRAWAQDHGHMQGKAFFEEKVSKPVRELASYAVEIITADLQPVSSLNHW